MGKEVIERDERCLEKIRDSRGSKKLASGMLVIGLRIQRGLATKGHIGFQERAII